MNMRQFNATYDVIQDRLLCRLSTDDGSEYRFWFSRRITYFIFAATEHLVQKQLEKKHAPPVAKVINEFQQEAGRAQTHFAESYKPMEHFPLGEEPILLPDIRFTLIDHETGMLMQVGLILPDQKELTLTLSLQTLQAMIVLLEKLAAQAQWSSATLIISPPTASPGAGATGLGPGGPTNPGDTNPSQLH